MPHPMTVQELIEQTQQLQQRFREQEDRPWTVEVYAMELLAEAGTLADSMVIKEGYRSLRPGQDLDLEDDICDLLFVILMIANHYGIDLESAYASMVESSMKKLEERKKQRTDHATGN